MGIIPPVHIRTDMATNGLKTFSKNVSVLTFLSCSAWTHGSAICQRICHHHTMTDARQTSAFLMDLRNYKESSGTARRGQVAANPGGGGLKFRDTRNKRGMFMGAKSKSPPLA